MAPPNPSASKAANPAFADQPVAVKAFILILAVTIVSAIYYFGFHMSLAEDIERAQREHTTLLQQRREAVERQQEFVRLSQELAAREPIDRRNRRVLPENPEMAAFLGDINRLAELSGLGIDLVQPEPETPDEFYVRIPVKLKFNGRFHQFAKFFHAISQLERAVSLENLNIVLDRVTPRAPPTPSSATHAATGSAQVIGAEPEPVAAEVGLRVELLATTYRRPRTDEAAPVAAGAAGARRPAAGARRPPGGMR